MCPEQYFRPVLSSSSQERRLTPTDTCRTGRIHVCVGY